MSVKEKVLHLKFVDVPIKNLIVNPSNDRHGPKGSEDKAIQWLFDKRGAHMVSLAKDILEQERISDAPLVKQKGQKFIVFDGNRRVTCLKVMSGLATAKGSAADTIAKLIKQSGWKSPNLITCQVENDQNVIDTILSRRHNGVDGGKGQLGWDLRAKANHSNRTGGTNHYPIAEAVESFLGETGYPRTGKIKRSTLFRLINTKGRQARFGIRLNDDGALETTKDEASVIRLLTRVADDIVEDKLTLVNLLNVKGINEYLDALSTEGFDLSTQSQNSGQSSINKTQGLNNPPKKPLKQSKPPKRDTLIPNEHISVAWKERQGKIERIWKDLQWNLRFSRTELAIPIAFRTLIELSTNYACKRLELQSSEALRKRVKTVAQALRDKGALTSKDFADLERLLGDQKSGMELEALHRVVHSQTADLNDNDLRAMWDSFESYLMEALAL